MPLIDLSLASHFVGVIITWPSGIRYRNQTGGSACSHPEHEGVLALLTDDVGATLNALTEHFEDVKKVPKRVGISHATADFVDEVLHEYPEHTFISVDRDRLDESHEAWVHVTLSPVKSDHDQSVGWFPAGKGVLVWENSD